MKNSEKFIKSLKDYKKRSRGLLIGLLCFLSAISISLLLNYKASFSNKLLPILYMGGIIVVTIIIIIVTLKYPDYCELTEEEKKAIGDELDNKIERGFPQYNIYITENYLVHMGDPTFAVPIKDILAISSYANGGYKYNKKKRKFSLIRIIIFDIFDFFYCVRHSNKHRQSIIVVTNKKRYRLGYYYFLNGKTHKNLEKIVEYICEKNKKIDWV